MYFSLIFKRKYEYENYDYILQELVLDSGRNPVGDGPPHCGPGCPVCQPGNICPRLWSRPPYWAPVSSQRKLIDLSLPGMAAAQCFLMNPEFQEKLPQAGAATKCQTNQNHVLGQPNPSPCIIQSLILTGNT